MNESIKILYVDKSEQNLIDLENIVNDDTFTMNFVSNLKKAEEFLLTNEVHIIICEREILLEENPNFLKWVSEEESLSHITKILVSTEITTEELIYSMNNCRIFRYFDKPFKVDIVKHLYQAYNHYIEKLDNQSLLSKLIYKTERLKETKAEVIRSENLYRILAKNIPNFAVMIFDRDFKFLLADGSALDKSGFENVEGKDICEVMDQDLVDELKPYYDHVLETGEIVSTEHDHRGKWYESQFIPIRNELDLEYDRCMIVVYETTKIKNLSIDLEKNVHELKNINLYMDNFVYAASHDLKAPVSNVKALMNLWNLPNMNKDEINTRIKNGVQMIDDTLDSLIEIIEVQKNNNINYKNVSIKKSYHKALKNIENHLHRSKAQIELNLEVENIKYIEPYLVSIIQNIMNNSMKYFDKDRGCFLKVETKQLKDYILLKIEDNGIGMDLEKITLEKLFEPFNRFSKKASGRGIGLHLVKNMVEKNGGYIEVESEVDKGTTFLIYLKEY